MTILLYTSVQSILTPLPFINPLILPSDLCLSVLGVVFIHPRHLDSLNNIPLPHYPGQNTSDPNNPISDTLLGYSLIPSFLKLLSPFKFKKFPRFLNNKFLQMNDDKSLHLNDLIHWLNQARENPQSLIPFLQKHLDSFRNDTQLEFAPNCFVKTQQGKKAWVEAISFLKYQQPVAGLKRHPGLDRSAEDHAVDLSKNNLMGEIGSDNSTTNQRIKRYCDFQEGVIGETIAQEFKKKVGNHARQTVLSLIVNDGETSRADRKSIFNHNFRYFGASVQKDSFRFVAVINYSSHNLPQLKVDPTLGQMSTNNYQSSSIKKTISLNTNDSENNSRTWNGQSLGDGKYRVGDAVERISFH